MSRKRLFVICLGALLLGVGISQFSVSRRSHADSDSLCRLEGTWVGLAGNGQTIFTVNYVPNNAGDVVQFEARAVNFDATLGGIFAGARAGSALRGEALRIGTREYAFRGISYAVRDLDGGGSEIVYIRIDEGVTELVDCETQKSLSTVSIYSPDADADGDGLPDPEAEPLFVAPPRMPGTIKRFRAE